MFFQQKKRTAVIQLSYKADYKTLVLLIKCLLNTEMMRSRVRLIRDWYQNNWRPSNLLRQKNQTECFI